MIDHMTLRVRDFVRSKAFFAAALQPLEACCHDPA